MNYSACLGFGIKAKLQQRVFDCRQILHASALESRQSSWLIIVGQVQILHASALESRQSGEAVQLITDFILHASALESRQSI